ncbi:MAG: CIA30 family protein [Spirochaetales bacterium]|nr:CIA30 family protein [Spirochaetales bacterium]
MKYLMLLSIMIILPFFVWAKGNAEYEVTEILPVDDFEDGDGKNLFGEVWETFDDEVSGGNSKTTIKTNHSPGYKESAHCLYAEYKLGSLSDYSYTGFNSTLQPEEAPMDLSEYFGIRFYAKGKGLFIVKIATTATLKQLNFHATNDIALSSEWQLYELPFSRFSIKWGTMRRWDPSEIIKVEWAFENRNYGKGEIYLDDIGFYKAVEVKKEAKEEKIEDTSIAEAKKNEKIIGQKKLNALKDKRIAVVGIDSGEVKSTVAEAIVGFITNAFVNQGTFKVMDRKSIEKILDEQSFQLADYADTTKMIEIGKLAGAEYIVTGTLSRVGDTYYLNIKLISVKTTEIVGSSIATAKDDTQFFSMSNNAVDKLFQ